MSIILPRSDIMLSSVNEISKICAPLRQYGITNFSHTRVYPDGSFIDMTDQQQVIDNFYYRSDLYKHYDPDMHPELLNGDFFLCSSLSHNKAIQVCREEFNIDNIIVLIEQVEDHYELWHFGSTRGNDGIVNFYINNLDFLKVFTLYFRDKAHKLIQKFEKEKIIRSPVLPSLILEHPHQISHHETFLKINGKSLTSREIDCISLWLHRFSAKEIALKLKLSHRTVEDHFTRIKNKLKITRASQLFSKVKEEGLLDHLLDYSESIIS